MKHNIPLPLPDLKYSDDFIMCNLEISEVKLPKLVVVYMKVRQSRSVVC